MANTLTELRQQQAKLESKINSLHKENDSHSTGANIVSGLAIGAGIGMAFVSGIGAPAAITIGLSYAVPEIAMTVAGNNIDSKIKQSTNDLSNNLMEQQYQMLNNQLSNTQNQQRQMELVSEIFDRHMDRYVRDVVERVERDIDSRDRSRDFDFVEPPSRDFDYRGNDFGIERDTAYA